MDEHRLVLVTGATGFIGAHLLEGLLAAEHTVVALHRRWSTEGLRCHVRLSWTTVEDVAACFGQRRPDAVIHLATCYGNGVSLAEMVASNVWMPLRLLELAAAQGCPLFVNTDSFFAKPEFNYSHMRTYIQSKNDFMRWAVLATEATPAIKIVNARLEHVYGPGDGAQKFIPHVLAKLLANDTLALTPGEQMRDFVHVDDVVSAYLTILKSGEVLPPGPIEIQVGTGTAHSVRTFVETARALCEATSRLDFGVHPYRNAEIMYSAADTAALAVLGWAPRHTLASGIRATLDAMPPRNLSSSTADCHTRLS
jgi:nucleoside-diphosphate-sugar epimerase